MTVSMEPAKAYEEGAGLAGGLKPALKAGGATKVEEDVAFALTLQRELNGLRQRRRGAPPSPKGLGAKDRGVAKTKKFGKKGRKDDPLKVSLRVKLEPSTPSMSGSELTDSESEALRRKRRANNNQKLEGPATPPLSGSETDSESEYSRFEQLESYPGRLPLKLRWKLKRTL